MIRNLKVLGLALGAVFAMSAVAASAASAEALTAESYPATVTGGDDTGVAGTDEFSTTAGVVKCPEATYHGTVAGPSTTLTLTPNFKHCTIAGSIPTIIDTNGCDFLFHIGTGASKAVTATLVCPVGKDITVTANQTTLGTSTVKCTIHVPPQTVSGLTVANAGVGSTGEIKVAINASGITYTHTAGTGLGACTTSVQQHTATFKGADLLTGEVEPPGSGHIGLFLSESAV